MARQISEDDYLLSVLQHLADSIGAAVERFSEGATAAVGEFKRTVEDAREGKSDEGARAQELE